ncbi:histidine triad nucleotide-binding protein [Geothrix fuzhouensis]|uniref:histidine triad nucleotide-binding protein n=1 Tax=Geothrix fuzhouensis TaxID=2966451 RepID=UPI00214979CF|nr:histidine triad nucleotide-binding protein [Geothrix fuzhouensis]
MIRQSLRAAVAVLILGAALPGQVPSASALAPDSATNAHPDCVFCRIVAGTAPSRKVYENQFVLAFWDIRPRAKVHLLVIPKQHVASLKELDDLSVEARAALLSACVKVAKDQGILEDGFRLISNSGTNASQSVFHLHFHVVGGERLREDAITKDPTGR